MKQEPKGCCDKCKIINAGINCCVGKCHCHQPNVEDKGWETDLEVILRRTTNENLSPGYAIGFVKSLLSQARKEAAQEPKIDGKGWDSVLEEKIEEFSTKFTNGIHVVDQKGECLKSSSVQDWLRTALTEACKEAVEEFENKFNGNSSVILINGQTYLHPRVIEVKKHFIDMSRQEAHLKAIAEAKDLGYMVGAQEQWEKDSKALEQLLTYCKEQNGMDYCKNCGLDANTLPAPQIANNDN